MPLITVDRLHTLLDEDDLVIVDVRWRLGNPMYGRDAYGAGHIPGAVFADLDDDLSDVRGPGRHPLPNPATFDEFLGSIGVAPSTTVVAYDDASGAIAARLWWMLTDQGHENTMVLDGGFSAWTTAGLPTDSGSVGLPGVSTAAGIATRPWREVVMIDAVADRDKGVLVVDARSGDRYRGDLEPVDARPGHIPGALNLPHTGNVDSAGRMLGPAALASRFSEIGVGADSAVIVHCGSGVTACHNILAAELAGLPRPRLYAGSWSEWASTDRPVAIGDQPG
ncbi:MAG: sulfurtransferase [Acidimicrobiia bacterium]|nr:sulfurtransferase [Acidimicrobiia bacterium]